MFLFRLVAASLAGRRPIREYTPTAVGWYGATASNHEVVAMWVTRSRMVTSIGATMSSNDPGLLLETRSRMKLPVSKSKSMAGAAAKPVPMLALLPMIYALVIVGGIVGTHWAMRDKTLEIAVERTPAWLVGGILGIMALAIVAEQGKGSAFIYFQF